jgi:DNA-binding NtrC family response regulator
VLAATNQPLSDLVRDGRFRADLYYRLQVLTLALPPLRERRDELPALAASFLPRGASLARGALDALRRYDWPGNVRELKNTLWRAALLAEGKPIEPSHLGLGRAQATTPSRAPAPPRTLADAERDAIADALRATDGNKVHAARLLGIARSTLNEKLKRLPEPG